MKRILCLILTFALLISSFVFQTAFAEDEIKVTINGQNLTMDQPPVLVNDRTLVPVRAIFEALGAKVSWNNDTNTATGELNGTTVEIQIENTVAKVNGKDVTLDVPAKLINDRTLVPVRFISESLGAKVDWDNDSQTVIIVVQSYVKKQLTLNFDDMDILENNIDFVTGGGMSVKSVSLSDEKDHTTGNGKSVKLDSIKAVSERIKFRDIFTPYDLGKTFKISGWFYSPNETNIRFGTYSDDDKYKKVACQSVTKSINANEWTLIEWEYKHEEDIVALVGFDQGTDKKVFSPTLYFDDLSVTHLSGSDDTKGPSEEIKDVVVTDGHRPVPTEFKNGKSYDDIIYYKEETADNETLYNNLPEGKTIVTDSVYKKIKDADSEYGTVEIVEVSDMPFTTALRVNCTKVPEKQPWDFKVSLGNILAQDNIKDGDVCLLKVYLRTIDTFDDESMTCHIMPVIEQKEKPFDKIVNTDLFASTDWTLCYLPFKFKDGFVLASLRLGYKIQTLEIGGYEVINYGNSVDISSLPTNSAMPVYLTKSASWRKEAWDRIEKIRKGDLNVIVKDAQGNVVPNAKVDVNMYETDFQWGTTISERAYGEGEEKYRKTIAENFNAGVTENALKWNVYDKNPDVPMKIIEASKKLGIKHFRGHCLMWDKATVNNGVNSAFPDYLPDYFDKYDEMQKIICDHITKTMGEFKGSIEDWDVFNEGNRSDVRIIPKYGLKMVKEWYDAARGSNSGAELYYNDYVTGGRLTEYVKSLVDNGVDFDGVGCQSHYSAPAPLADVISTWEKIAQMGKRLKVTEYSFANPSGLDEELQASFTRDLMIAAFSVENMDGFVMWGHAGGSDNSKPLYDKDYNPRKALEVYQDLVYNKWWTRESGNTSQDGTYSVKAYYGDYDITVSANGKTKTVNASCHKGDDNTVVVTLD